MSFAFALIGVLGIASWIYAFHDYSLRGGGMFLAFIWPSVAVFLLTKGMPSWSDVNMLAWLFAVIVAGMMFLIALVVPFTALDHAYGERAAKKEREFLDSLPPEKRAEEIMIRKQAVEDMIRDQEHKRQLEEDLRTIDRHYKRW